MWPAWHILQKTCFQVAASKLKFLFKIFYWLGLAALLYWLVSCTAPERLNKLVAAHPELVHTDTTTATKEIAVPGYTADGGGLASVDVSGLTQILEQFRSAVDKASYPDLEKRIADYIINRPCLADTLSLLTPGGGSVKVWQWRGRFFITAVQPRAKITATVPVTIMRIDAHPVYHWSMFTAGFFLGVLVFIGTVSLLAKAGSKIENPL